MLDTMLDYAIAMMNAISVWLSTPPMIYILGFLLATFVVKIFLMIIGFSSCNK